MMQIKNASMLIRDKNPRKLRKGIELLTSKILLKRHSWKNISNIMKTIVIAKHTSFHRTKLKEIFPTGVLTEEHNSFFHKI